MKNIFSILVRTVLTCLSILLGMALLTSSFCFYNLAGYKVLLADGVLNKDVFK